MSTTEAPPAVGPADPDQGTGTLAAKLARIMGQLDRITRDGSVDGRAGYSYASADTISDTLRPAMAAEGIVLLPRRVVIEEHSTVEIEKSGSDGPYTQFRESMTIVVDWTLTDGETTYEVGSTGTGIDFSGKAANAAHTFARVNALKSIYHLSTGDDPEKPASSSGGGGSRREWTGELPTMNDPAGVSGVVSLSEDGQKVGIKHRAEDGVDFTAIKDAAKALAARWNSDAKLWELPAAKAETAVLLGRHVGLSIAPALAERFPAAPAQTADDLAPGADSLPVGDQPARREPDDDDTPF